MPMTSSEIMFWKRALHKCVHIHTFIPIHKALFQNTINELCIGIASLYFGMALIAFLEKSSSIEQLAVYNYRGLICGVLLVIPWSARAVTYKETWIQSSMALFYARPILSPTQS